MAITKNRGRQGVIFAYVDVSFADIVSGTAAVAIDLPVGASLVNGGDIVVTTAFNSGTSDVIVIGDALSANRYFASASIAAAGRTALLTTGYVALSTSNQIKVTWTAVGTAATAGAFRLRVAYIVDKRAAFAQG